MAMALAHDRVMAIRFHIEGVRLLVQRDARRSPK
jgi:hypothetical protein